MKPCIFKVTLRISKASGRLYIVLKLKLRYNGLDNRLGGSKMDEKPDNCKVATTLDMIVGKWKIAIMLHLLHNGTMRFNELGKVMPGVTPKVLTSHLRELEEEGVILRVVYPQVPPKVEYSMTEYGESLQMVLDMMHDWGVSHMARKQQLQSRQLFENDNG